MKLTNTMIPKEMIAILALKTAQPEALQLYTLLNNDVNGARIAYSHFIRTNAKLDPMMNQEVIYHASCFVCAGRRVSRLLEAMSKRRTCFDQQVAECIKLEWRKKRTFFKSFEPARNAIEHIDGEVNSKFIFSAYNLMENELVVVGGKKLRIDENTIKKIIDVRDTITDKIIECYDSPEIKMLKSAMMSS